MSEFENIDNADIRVKMIFEQLHFVILSFLPCTTAHLTPQSILLIVNINTCSLQLISMCTEAGCHTVCRCSEGTGMHWTCGPWGRFTEQDEKQSINYKRGWHVGLFPLCSLCGQVAAVCRDMQNTEVWETPLSVSVTCTVTVVSSFIDFSLLVWFSWMFSS